MKIYTKTGDKGETAYIGGRVSKDSGLIELIGSVDELNSILGICVSICEKEEICSRLTNIQSLLFQLGAEIIDVENTLPKYDFSKEIIILEENIDEMSEELPNLKNFILPGGSLLSSYLHHSRSVCRRVERVYVGYLNDQQSVDKADTKLRFLNRLSDWFFTLARYANKLENKEEVLWNSKQ